MEGHSSISTEILASYAADAACEVDGVRAVVEGALPRHRGVKVSHDTAGVSLELHLALRFGAVVPEVGGAVQARVASYLGRMADVTPVAVDVVVDEIDAPAARA